MADRYDITMKYVVFKTRWGWFGLLAVEQGLIRASLPTTTKAAAQARLLAGNDAPKFVKTLYKPIQDKVVAYFEGEMVDFNVDTPVFLQNLPPFTRSVLLACRRISFGQTSTYSALAAAVGQPKAVRAVANALARNTLPLIVPCHRIIRSDGKIGGFSVPGGKGLKKRLIKHEHTAIANFRSI